MKSRLRKVSVTCQGHTVENKVESIFELVSARLQRTPCSQTVLRGTYGAVTNSQGYIGHLKYLRKQNNI